MTSVRFVGDLPLWMGLLLSASLAVMAWRYYRRESLELPAGLRRTLPLLRSLAFFLTAMILTGPVLHHRKVIGELGRVKIYIDGSASMTMRDPHMSTGRKLLAAEQMGWLPSGQVDATFLQLADKLATARRRFADQTAAADDSKPPLSEPSGADSETATEASGTAAQKAARLEFLQRLEELQGSFPPDVAARCETELLTPLRGEASTDATTDTESPEIQTLLDSCGAVEGQLRALFESSVEALVQSDREDIAAALALFDETPRWRRVEIGINGSAISILTELRTKHDVEVFRLVGADAMTDAIAAEVTESSDENDADRTPPVFADLTDLSSGISATQETAAVTSINDRDQNQDSRKPQTAVVVLTDGQHNAGPSPQQTAGILGRQGLAFYTVSFGAEREAPDMALIGLEYPRMVFRKDRVRGTLVVRDRMPEGTPFVVQISHGDETLWQEELVTQMSGDRRVEFEFSVEELVQRLGTDFDADVRQNAVPLALNAAIAALPGESELANNDRSMRLAAITEGYKLLIIDGRTRWETRYLRNVFERDDQWSVTTVVAGPGTDATTLPRGDQDNQFPPDRDALFEYDLVVFGEVDPALLAEHEMTWLREFVELRGGGLVFIDGQRGKLRQLTEPGLRPLLPVEWLPDEMTSRPESLQLTDKGAAEPALSLATDEQKNRRFWSELPAPHTLVPVNPLPGAEVLVEVQVAGQRRPAIVTRRFGAGRVLYLACDETWRWRYKVADVYHQRIWNQLAKFVMPPPFAVSDEYLAIDTGPVSYEFGDSVPIRIRLKGRDGKPAVNAIVDALIRKDGRVVSTVSLTADPDVPGIYRGRTEDFPAGAYEVSVRASDYSESVLKARTEFVVLPPESGEMEQTASSATVLQAMAEASGGAFLREEQLALLPELLSPLSSGRVVESDTLIWQSYWWFAAIVTLLTVEWMLRKRAGLL